jgi:type IV pilus assembly protein PilC
MPTFEYEVIDRAGTVARGRQQAEGQDELIQAFRERGQLVVALKPTGAGPAPSVRGAVTRSFRNMGGRVKLSVLVLFTAQLAAMLEAGIHLVRILTSLARETNDKRFAKIVDDIRASISAGASFAAALSQYPRVFGKLYVAVVRAGEASGALSIVLNSLTTNLEKMEQLRRKVKGAMAYPIGILTVAVLIVLAMIIKIVPIFEEVYEKANAKLPFATQVLINISWAVRNYAVLVILSVGVLTTAIIMAARTERGRDTLDLLKLRMPLFGQLIRKTVIARVCRTLALLLQSGVPLMEALEIATHVVGSRSIERALATTTRGVRDGATMADMMRKTGAFPALVIQLVATGEESGSLAMMLGKAAHYYESQVDAAVDGLSSLIEPVMIVLMGGLAGGVIFALYMPIFNLGQALKSGLK